MLHASMWMLENNPAQSWKDTHYEPGLNNLVERNVMR